MKPIKDGTLDELEDVAREGIKQMRAFFSYQGENPSYHYKAKIGASAVTALAKLRSSENERMAMTKRVSG